MAAAAAADGDVAALAGCGAVFGRDLVSLGLACFMLLGAEVSAMVPSTAITNTKIARVTMNSTTNLLHNK